MVTTTTEEQYELVMLTPLKDEDKRDKYQLFIDSMQKKYPQFNNQIKRLLYNEDKEKVLDNIFLSLLDSKTVYNFRISRDDNMQSMQNYRRSKIKGQQRNNKQYDSAVYSLKSKVSYYFGFDY
jgi:hypothetical protein